MSVRGVEFLEDWIQQNVTARDISDDPLRASNLAMRCILDATALGFTLEEIKPEWGSLESHIADAMMQLNQSGQPEDSKGIE